MLGSKNCKGTYRMLLNAYTLYDVKAVTYSPPFYAHQHGEAMRMVMQLAEDPNTTVGRHPADFTLYCVGRFDTSTGQLLSGDAREHITDVLPLAPGGRQRDFFNSPGDHEPSNPANGSAS